MKENANSNCEEANHHNEKRTHFLLAGTTASVRIAIVAVDENETGQIPCAGEVIEGAIAHTGLDKLNLQSLSTSRMDLQP